MRVVFIDIDGVLNSDAYFRALEHAGEALTEWWGERCLDPRAIALLDALLTHADATAVISSSWRQRFSLSELDAMFRARGLSRTLHSVTPSMHRTPDGARLTRGDEVQAWLDAHDAVDAFVILEDEEELSHLEPFAMRVSTSVGLGRDDVERAIEALVGGRFEQRTRNQDLSSR